MDPAKYEYQSEFARRYFGQGKAEGKSEGKAELLVRQLTRRFGRISAAARARLDAASPEDLDRWAERFIDAASLEEVFGP